MQESERCNFERHFPWPGTCCTSGPGRETKVWGPKQRVSATHVRIITSILWIIVWHSLEIMSSFKIIPAVFFNEDTRLILMKETSCVQQFSWVWSLQFQWALEVSNRISVPGLCYSLSRRLKFTVGEFSRGSNRTLGQQNNWYQQCDNNHFRFFPYIPSFWYPECYITTFQKRLANLHKTAVPGVDGSCGLTDHVKEAPYASICHWSMLGFWATVVGILPSQFYHVYSLVPKPERLVQEGDLEDLRLNVFLGRSFQFWGCVFFG